MIESFIKSKNDGMASLMASALGGMCFEPLINTGPFLYPAKSDGLIIPATTLGENNSRNHLSRYSTSLCKQLHSADMYNKIGIGDWSATAVKYASIAASFIFPA